MQTKQGTLWNSSLTVWGRRRKIWILGDSSLHAGFFWAQTTCLRSDLRPHKGFFFEPIRGGLAGVSWIIVPLHNPSVFELYSTNSWPDISIRIDREQNSWFHQIQQDVQILKQQSRPRPWRCHRRVHCFLLRAVSASWQIWWEKPRQEVFWQMWDKPLCSFWSTVVLVLEV